MFRDPVAHRIKTLNNLLKRNIVHKTGSHPDKTTLMQTWIIGFIKQREDKGIDTFQKDIEEEFSINRSTTSEMIKLMCCKEMVERVSVDYDARLKKIVITNQGYQIINEMEKLHIKLNKELVDGVSKEDLDVFNRVADKMIDNIKKQLD